jgi:hypothetical protein
METDQPINETELDRRLAELPLLDLPEAAADRQEAAALAVLARRRRGPALRRAWAFAVRELEPLLVALVGAGYILAAVLRAVAAHSMAVLP